jgi:hypothetical protein
VLLAKDTKNDQENERQNQPKSDMF